MGKRKLVHIYYRAYDAYFPEMGSDYYYLAGWSSVIARQTKNSTCDYIVENWRPEREIKEPVIREVEGIVCRLFPTLSAKSNSDWSPEIWQELKKQAQTNEILIHHSGIHNTALCLIASIFRNIPIIAQHHGDMPALTRYQQDKRLRSLAAHYIERAHLRNVDHFFVLNRTELEFLSRYVPISRISLQTMGIDFEKFKPMDKILARRALGISADKKIILYIGRYYRLKGIDIVLNTFRELRQRHNIGLILIGGAPTDEFYDEVRMSGALFFGRVPHDDLVTYFNAADVFLLPIFSPKYAGGIGVATMEALACSLPVVSTTLRDLPTQDYRKFGRIPKDIDDVSKCIEDVFLNSDDYANCREAAREYYDWKIIARRTIKIYDALFKEYYG